MGVGSVGSFTVYAEPCFPWLPGCVAECVPVGMGGGGEGCIENGSWLNVFFGRPFIV